MSTIINVHEAQAQLPRLVEDVATGRESPVVIHGEDNHFVVILSLHASKIAAYQAELEKLHDQLLPSLAGAAPKRQLGVAKGKYRIPSDIDAHNADIQRDFEGS